MGQVLDPIHQFLDQLLQVIRIREIQIAEDRVESVLDLSANFIDGVQHRLPINTPQCFRQCIGNAAHIIREGL